MSLKDLLNYLEAHGCSGVSDWKDQIERIDPTWRDIFRNPENWKKLEYACRASDYDVLLDYEHGYGLWDASINISPEEWNYHSDGMKEFIIEATFRLHPGMPYDIFEKFLNHLRDFRYEDIRHFKGVNINIPLSFSKYVPSYRVNKLKIIVESAGDTKYVDYINRRIKDMEEILSSSAFFRTMYEPTDDEKELISTLLKEFTNKGFSLSRLPEIQMSDETPPLFIMYPELENRGNNKRLSVEKDHDDELKNDLSVLPPKLNKNGALTYITIELLLGCYLAADTRIVIYRRGLNWTAAELHLDVSDLKTVVLLHEISHWIMHKLPLIYSPEYDINLYKYSSEWVHEGWAQLLTYWVVSGSKWESTFNELNRFQSRLYKIYRRFINTAKDKVVDSLIKLRGLRFPATLESWEFFLR